MKNILLFLFITMPIMVNAQFSLTIDGFVCSEDNSKDYVVFEYENQPKEDLFINVLKFITSNYKSAKDVISKVDNEVITINAFQPKQIYAKSLKYDIKYTLVISFKDNKIKIDRPSFECSTYAFDKPYRLTMSGSNAGLGSEVTVGLFKKDGKPNQERAIVDIETFINGLCNRINSASLSNNTKDNW